MHIPNVNDHACIYCGVPATDRDHVVPHSLTKGRLAKQSERKALELRLEHMRAVSKFADMEAADYWSL